MTRRIGLLYGVERTFPAALAEETNRVGEGRVACGPVRIGPAIQDRRPPYDVILDRISHEVPYYRTFLKQCAFSGIQVINNPFWFSADDKYTGNLIAMQAGVAVPRTALLPHRSRPSNTRPESYANLEFPIDWDEVFGYLGFPVFVKPMDGGGWRDVHRCDDPDEFFEAYDASGTRCMMAQEAIDFTDYFRCYVVGREHVHPMRYDPRRPHHARYVKDAPPIEPELKSRLDRDCLALCTALGYDFNTVELAVRDGVPYAIDFTNPCPDADVRSVGEANFEWVVSTSARFLVQRALEPRPFELTGTWPREGER